MKDFYFKGELTAEIVQGLALRSTKRTRMILWGLVVLFWIAAMLYFLFLKGNLFLSAGLFTIFVLGVEAYIRLSVVRTFKKTPLLQGLQETWLNDKSLRIKNKSGQREIKAEQFSKIKISEKAADFYINKQQAISLLKDWLQDGNWADFTKLVEEHWIK
ncbi:YcxB family protein [Lactococcus termiticola]|uniref:Uncharacterized protein n=1 Tax=Lactococcus termiticola TaxID=2169526 RepID=A0A2R5HH00_9LACT|nr:YcxB family protein [Lactococcus termiticola]GBG97284.1 hypothetical protein NtB2_01423 [Lactococcus termiticola]